MLETTVCKLDVNEPYVNWVRKFYNEETPARSAKGAKVIFRGVSNDNPYKVIFMVKALECLRETHTREY